MASRKEETDRFPAQTESGTVYEVVEFADMVDATDTETGGPAVVYGDLSYETADGEKLNKIGEGVYEMPGPPYHTLFADESTRS